MNNRIHRITEAFAVLKPNLLVDTVNVTPALYANLDTAYNAFKGHVLISVYEFDQPWSSWERHPAGDEIVMLLSGETEFLLRENGGETRCRLTQPGEYIVVPKGLWHTAIPRGNTKMLFITPGEGTEHRSEKILDLSH